MVTHPDTHVDTNTFAINRLKETQEKITESVKILNALRQSVEQNKVIIDGTERLISESMALICNENGSADEFFPR